MYDVQSREQTECGTKVALSGSHWFSCFHGVAVLFVGKSQLGDFAFSEVSMSLRLWVLSFFFFYRVEVINNGLVFAWEGMILFPAENV